MGKKKLQHTDCSSKKVNNQPVRPLRFQALPDIGEEIKQNVYKRKSTNNDACSTLETNISEMVTKVTKLEPNFSFEYSYPAVVFDKVCFRVNKSQQQANLLNELLYKFKNCLHSSSNSKDDRKVDILKSVNLSVPYGSIFGLLGPSSCGKTTLLRCLVGLLKPSSGSIRLFGHSSDNSEQDKESNERLKWGSSFNFMANESDTKREQIRCKVPGSNVGYMPQDLGIYEDFTIRQLLTMFGQYVGMDSKLIKTRISFMAEFLDLPEVDREIFSLSGGQKRRVSFAIACLHMPPLIILDEPTVGVDPLLRQSIWKYLRRLADEERKTIIITTHYIEEAAQADQVALMRAGEILVQDKPSKIMESNGCKTLEEAFLKICNNIQHSGDTQHKYKLYPQPRFNWHDQLKVDETYSLSTTTTVTTNDPSENNLDSSLEQLRMKAQEKLLIFKQLEQRNKEETFKSQFDASLEDAKFNKLSMTPDLIEVASEQRKKQSSTILLDSWHKDPNLVLETKERERLDKIRSFLNHDNKNSKNSASGDNLLNQLNYQDSYNRLGNKDEQKNGFYDRISKSLRLMWALLYKNYRRNVNSLPLLAFQFMLPIIQMISFSLCVGGKPTNIGLGVVNRDSPAQLLQPDLLLVSQPGYNISSINFDLNSNDSSAVINEELLSTRYLSFVDQSMIAIKPYDNLKDALDDVRKAKLWAAMEIGENFTTTILQRFDLENFYQLELDTIKQSVIKLYPDRSNKVVDMICHRSIINSYRKFLLDQFEHFKRLPIEVREPIFDIKPNLISNSVDGYTESIAAGLLASLTYIMAAGLTTFIMVVERSAGILERTYTSGINPVAYLLAHALFRSLVMMAQIAVVMFLTFYILRQPLVGSGWLAYLMLMTLNLTGISYGLLISSLVTDQNGAALTIVSSLVVKITMSGILWPFEAIPRWLRFICYVQPLTMPVQALKTITLKGNGLEDQSVYLGFLVSISWLVIFLTISAKRFKFYQH